jgi:hypothetical protein
MVVTHFPGDVGGDLDNVNRWRQQVGQAPVTQADLEGMVSKVTACGKTSSVIDATGPQSRVVAGWARHGAEKAKFTSFLESVRFTKPE